MARTKTNVAQIFLAHPDKDEIVSKLLLGISPSDISEWLGAKYSEVNDQRLALSINFIKKVQDDYLDFYTQVKDDLEKRRSPDLVLQEDIQGTPAYQKALEKYIDSEIDVKVIVKRMVVNVEARISQMYDIIQEDPRNFKADRTLLEWFNTLGGVLEKYDGIINGNQEQVNIQNNINIQVLDTHMNAIYDIIREILTMLDYETSLRFIELWTERTQSLLKAPDQQIIPVEQRLVEVKKTEQSVEKALNQ